MSQDPLLKELDFVLSHPACNIDNLNSFYYNSLFIYPQIPVLNILNQVKKANPRLLREWSRANDAVEQLVKEFDIFEESTPNQAGIIIEINPEDLNQITHFFLYNWNTSKLLEADEINTHLKNKTIQVRYAAASQYASDELEIVGISQNGKNKYTIYIRKKGEMRT